MATDSLVGLKRFVSKLEARQDEATKEMLGLSSSTIDNTVELKEEVCWDSVMNAEGDNEGYWDGGDRHGPHKDENDPDQQPAFAFRAKLAHHTVSP